MMVAHAGISNQDNSFTHNKQSKIIMLINIMSYEKDSGKEKASISSRK